MLELAARPVIGDFHYTATFSSPSSGLRAALTNPDNPAMRTVSAGMDGLQPSAR